MSKIGTLKITIEFIFYWILINFLQEINVLRFYGEYTIKLCALYFFLNHLCVYLELKPAKTNKTRVNKRNPYILRTVHE